MFDANILGGSARTSSRSIARIAAFVVGRGGAARRGRCAGPVRSLVVVVVVAARLPLAICCGGGSATAAAGAAAAPARLSGISLPAASISAMVLGVIVALMSSSS